MDDLIGEFIEETSESIALLDSELVILEQNPEDEKTLGNIFRLVHTIKGTCGFLGLPRLEHVAHAAENILGKIRDKTMEVSPLAISLVLESLDRIKELLAHLSSEGAEPAGSDEELIGRLNAFVAGDLTDKSVENEEAVEAEESSSSAIEKVALIEGEPIAAEDAAKVRELAKGKPASFKSDDDELQRIFDETPDLTGQMKNVKPAAKTAKAKTAEKTVEKTVEKVVEKPKAAAAVAPKEAAKAAVMPASPPAADGDDDKKNALANQSIRVNLDVLETLMQTVGELVLTRNQLLQITRGHQDKELVLPIQRLSLITSELQEQVMKTRMQPIGNAWAKFPRMIRDLAMELNKKIDLRMIGAETELDRQLLEMIKDPLTHMVRNSADHGLERTEERREAGKSEIGTVTLSAFHEGGHIIIEIKDDGRGINVDRVKAKAVANGIATAEEVAGMSDNQICQFIFKAGFSTAEVVTSVSGRGVGMDVVRTNIEKIGGTIDLESQLGKGSTFNIKIPLTLAIVSVLVLESGGQRFAIPQINVLELVRATKKSQHKIEEINGSAVLRLRDNLLPLLCLSEVLLLEEKRHHNTMESSYIIVCKVGGMEYGLIVDQIYDTEEIVVKPKSELLRDIDIYSGMTILGDGGVIMILDPNGLARRVGEADGIKPEEDTHRLAAPSDDEQVSFLLFSTGDKNPKAIPLELVARLEEIEMNKVEYSSGQPVVQYRNTLMRLMVFEGMEMPTGGTCEVMVFQYDGRIMGMVVKEILDIVKAPYVLKMRSTRAGLMGSMVLSTKTTDIIDIGHYIAEIFGKAPQQASSEVRQRLLFAEDSPFFRNLTLPFLEQAGFEVIAVDSGEAALEVLYSGKQQIDVVVTDIEMPGMGGFELAKAIKKDPNFSHLPVYGFTSTVNEKIVEQAKQVGFADYIEKTNRSQLIAAIRNIGQATPMYKKLVGA
jgi:two-component system chemotaxis sensor kinase CheA